MLPIPIRTDMPQRRVPWVNILLIAANVIIYLISHGRAHAEPGEPEMTTLLRAWEPFMLYPDGRIQLYQFVTYQFMHATLMHLLGNMLFLWVFGNNLNEKLGHVGYFTVYITGGILAGCGQVLTSSAPTLGASGSIAAVTGLFLALLPRTNIRTLLWIYFYVDIFEIPSLWFILFSVAKDIIEPYLFPGSHVAHFAHLAGYFSGFLIGLLLLRAHLVRRDHYDLLALIDRRRRRRQYESLVSRGYDPFANARVAAEPVRIPPVQQPVIPPEVSAQRAVVLDHLHNRDLPGAAQQYLELRRLDPRQVLSQQDQLDIANQLMSEGSHEAAAQAYEDYLRIYPHAHHIEQIQLILGLIYARYLPRAQRAIELFRAALPQLHDVGQRQLAESELARLAPENPLPDSPSAPSAGKPEAQP